MAAVEITEEAIAQLGDVPKPIQGRIYNIVRRLSAWPAVSGAKPLRRELSGNFRIRTGDYRIVFNYRKTTDVVTIWKIGYRGGVYD